MNNLKDSKLFEIELGLGAWQWGEKHVWGYGDHYFEEDIENAFLSSLRLGVKMVDTAEVYGSGRSEKILGQLLNKSGAKPYIASKYFPFPWRWTKGSVERAFENTLTRIGIDYLDLYQIHWPNPIVPAEIQLDGIANMVRKGRLGAIGVSNFSQTQMMRAVQILMKNDLPLASNQIEFNLLNRSAERNGLLKRCEELGIRVIAYSPLAMGLLTGKYTPENPPSGFRGIKYKRQLQQLLPLTRLMTEIGQELGGKTLSQIAINWCICKGTLPIPGAKNMQQAEANAGALGWRLTNDQVIALDKASEAFS